MQLKPETVTYRLLDECLELLNNSPNYQIGENEFTTYDLARKIEFTLKDHADLLHECRAALNHMTEIPTRKNKRPVSSLASKIDGSNCNRPNDP